MIIICLDLDLDLSVCKMRVDFSWERQAKSNMFLEKFDRQLGTVYFRYGVENLTVTCRTTIQFLRELQFNLVFRKSDACLFGSIARRFFERGR